MWGPLFRDHLWAQMTGEGLGVQPSKINYRQKRTVFLHKKNAVYNTL